MTSRHFMQLETMKTIGDKEILEVQMEHKVKIIEALEKHKIHPKAKAWMNIPLYHMIFMLIVGPTFKME